MTFLSNVVAYACRHSRAEDRRMAFFGDPYTGDQSFGIQSFPSAESDRGDRGAGRSPGAVDWRIACGNCGNPSSPPRVVSCHRRGAMIRSHAANWRRAIAKRRRSCPPAKTKGLAVASQALDFIGGAKRDRTVDLYNAIVALSQLSYGPETSGTARDIIPAPLTGNRGTGNSA